MLSPTDHQKVEQAVRTAEASTSGEIVCILAGEVSNYREVPLAVASAVALIGPPVALLLGWRPTAIATWASDWSSGPGGSALTLARGLEIFAGLQCLLFAVVAGLAAIPAVRRRLTPPSLKAHRVHRAALQQFLATGLHASTDRTGVVIFASERDRRVELLADDAIHAAVGDLAWNAAVKAVQDGMRQREPASGLIRAVEICGEALARHFPAASPHGDRGDHLVEI